MAKFSEETLINFICEFTGIILEFEPGPDDPDWPKTYVEDDYIFRYFDKMVYLEWVQDSDPQSLVTSADCVEMSVQEFTGDDSVVAYLSCEGRLYEELYEFEAYGAHPEVEGLLGKLLACTKKYGMYWDWADGALKFYDATEV